mgnify:CR=1 FL=1
MEKTKQRIGWIDVTKGIAILLVILGHSLVGLKINDYIFCISHAGIFLLHQVFLFRQKSILAVIKKKCAKTAYSIWYNCGVCYYRKGSQCIYTALDTGNYKKPVY